MSCFVCLCVLCNAFVCLACDLLCDAVWCVCLSVCVVCGVACCVCVLFVGLCDDVWIVIVRVLHVCVRCRRSLCVLFAMYCMMVYGLLFVGVCGLVLFVCVCVWSLCLFVLLVI